MLDNFHFDLSLAQSLHQESEEGDVQPEADTKRKAEGGVTELESEESQEELEIEEEENECVQEEKERSVREGDVTKQRAMAQKIHKAIVNSILPSLEGVLTKRVSKY